MKFSRPDTSIFANLPPIAFMLKPTKSADTATPPKSGASSEISGPLYSRAPHVRLSSVLIAAAKMNLNIFKLTEVYRGLNYHN